MIDLILSDPIYNNFDVRQVKDEVRRDEALDEGSKAFYDMRLNGLEQQRRRREELERIKGDLSLARVATVYHGEFGYVPESPASLPAATSDPALPPQRIETLESLCSEPTVAELRVKR